MTPAFDPYHRWLGIRPEEQPADHYRLLGLARFEDDIEVIRDAAERQMSHVRRYATGEHAEDAKRILNELGGAKAGLIVQDKKLAYDATLQAGVVVERDVRHAAETPEIDLLTSSAAAPILLEIVEPSLGVMASTPDVDDPLQRTSQPTTPAYSTAPTPARRRPKTLAQMQSLRQPQRPQAFSWRLGVGQVDDVLKRIAGDDNALLHGFLRVFAIAVAIIFPVVCLLAVGSWAIHWSSDAAETVASPSATVASPLPTIPTPTATPTPPPTPPPLVLAPIRDAEVDEEQELRLEFALADAESASDLLSFEFVGVSHGAILDSSGVFTWTPTEAQGPGTFPFQVRAVASSDAAQPHRSEPCGFHVMVREVNQPPQFESMSEQQVTVGAELKLILRATDPDFPANSLTFAPLKKPNLGDVDPATGEFCWTPSESNASGEIVDLVVEVRDNGSPPQSARQTIRIRVQPQPLEPRITNSIGMQLALIPAGDFLMGSLPTEKDRGSNEHQHRVYITQPFYIATTEVTQDQWQTVMNTTPWIRTERYRGKKRMENVREGSDYPATGISWKDADEFCQRISASESREYRLPTEAEWEYACRAGSTTTYCFGDAVTSLMDYAWYRANALEVDEKYGHRVGQKRANAFGLFDMHGNVWEWCADWYVEDYYLTPTATTPNPVGPATGSSRVSRGGSWGSYQIYGRGGDGWYDSAQSCRSAFRDSCPPDARSDNRGFRVALDATTKSTTREPKPIESAEETSNSLGMPLKLIPAGESLLGSPASEEIPRSVANNDSSNDLSRIYGALRITDVQVQEYRIGERERRHGEWLKFSYKLTNTSKEELSIPLDGSLSSLRYCLGVCQHWVERQGIDSTIPGISEGTTRNGKKYAAGGNQMRVTKPTIASGESLTFHKLLDTTGFPTGRYSYSVVYQSLSNNALDSKTVEFVLSSD
jgi:formylglycine-generating enzyme required for sulfatase activity